MKSKLAVFMIICVLMITLPNASYAQYDAYKPILGVVQPADVQVVRVGETNTFTVTVKNSSSMAARMVRVSLSGDHPFRSDINDLTESITYLNPNTSKDVTFSADLSPTVASRIYDFDIVLEYYNYYDSTYSKVEKGYVKVENDNVEPIIGLVKTPNSDPVIEPDTAASVAFKLKNTGTVAAKDLRITASGFSNQGVVLYNDVETKAVKELGADETSLVYFNIISGKDMQSGTFPVDIEVAYNDDFGGTYTQKFTSYLTLNAPEEEELDVEMAIENLKVPSKIIPGTDTEISFDVVNTGEGIIERAELTLTYPGEFISKSSSKVIVKDLDPGEKQSFSYKIMAREETETESYHAYIESVFYGEDGSFETAQRAQEYVGLYVESANEGASKPKLIIDNYEYGGEYVYAGNPYVLNLEIKNTSNSTGTRNIKVTLTSEENVFTPVESSSSFFIPAIGPGEVHQHAIDLKTKIDANVKIYSLTVKMDYEDSDGNAYDQNKNPYEETESLSVAVAQPVRLETSELSVPFEIYSGQPFYIEQEFYNMGKSTMYNMMVKLEDVETNEGSYFVGNFDAGRSDYFSAQVYPSEVGEFSGTLVYSFEDALGNVTTMEEPFTYVVMEAMNFEEQYPMEPMEPEMPMEETESNIGKYIIAGIAILAVILFFVWKSRRKKRLARELEAFDE